MAIIKQLKEYFTKQNIYPVTVTNAVFDTDGNRLSEYLNSNLISSDDVFEEIEDTVPIVADRIGEYTADQIGFMLEQYVTPEMFGAKGDGITDDTEAIQMAINSSNRILFPPGTYCISKQINVPSYKELTGTPNSILKALDSIGEGYALLRVLDSTDININGLTFVGSKTIGDTENGISLMDFRNSKNITIDNCIYRENLYSSSRFMDCKNVKITRCNHYATDCGIITLSNTADDFYIDNCLFDGKSDISDYVNNSSEPISFYCATEMKNIHVSNCTMRNKVGHAMLFSNDGRATASNVFVDNITVINCNTALRVFNTTNGVFSNITNISGDEFNNQCMFVNNTNNCIFSNITSTDSTNTIIRIDELSHDNTFTCNLSLSKPTEESMSRFFIIKGNFNDITANVTSKSDVVKSIYVHGSNNKLKISGKKYGSETMRVFIKSEAENNYIELFDDISYYLEKNVTTTDIVSNKIIANRVTNVIMRDGVFNTSYSECICSTVSSVTGFLQNPENLQLMYNGCKLKLIYNFEFSGTFTPLSGGNIVWKSTDDVSFDIGDTVVLSFLQVNNKWIQL